MTSALYALHWIYTLGQTGHTGQDNGPIA